MDPDYEEDDAEAQAMAAAMGFSGFGSQKPPVKKRKFNAASDAYVDGQQLTKLDKGGRKGQGSGGNTMPLGKARVFGKGGTKSALETSENPSDQRVAPVAGNSDEIDLGDDFDEAGPNYIDTSKTPPTEAVGDGGPVDANQSPPVSEAEAREMQARIDAILSSIEEGDQSTDAPPPEHSIAAPPQRHILPQRPTYGDTAFMQGSPRPRADSDFNDSASIASSFRPSQRGERNPNWYTGYYDPNFNENPWEKLEKERGLQPLCEWPDNIGRRRIP